MVPVVARHLTSDDQLSGYQIPAGSTIIAHLHAVHDDGWKQPARCCDLRFTAACQRQISYDLAASVCDGVPTLSYYSAVICSAGA